MPIYKGSTKLGTIYHGGTKIGKGYKGATLVYSGGMKILTLKYTIDSSTGFCYCGFFDGINYLPGQPLMLGIGLTNEGVFAVEKITSISDTSLSIASNNSYRNPFNINIGTIPFIGWIRSQANVPTNIAYVITSPKARVGDYCIQGNSANAGFGWSAINVSSDDGTTVTYTGGLGPTNSFNKSTANASTQYLYRA